MDEPARRYSRSASTPGSSQAASGSKRIAFGVHHATAALMLVTTRLLFVS
jgi:hypothetical protein